MKKTQFKSLATTAWKFRLFLLRSLPAAWFMGLSVSKLEEDSAEVALPYSWYAKNPFRSTYFAAQVAAGELSTGILLMYHMQERAPVSMLVTELKSAFHKKATETLTFRCEMGLEVDQMIQKVLAQDQGETITLHSVGTLPDGTKACDVWITWSLKKKRSA